MESFYSSRSLEEKIPRLLCFRAREPEFRRRAKLRRRAKPEPGGEDSSIIRHSTEGMSPGITPLLYTSLIYLSEDIMMSRWPSVECTKSCSDGNVGFH